MANFYARGRNAIKTMKKIAIKLFFSPMHFFARNLYFGQTIYLNIPLIYINRDIDSTLIKVVSNNYSWATCDHF